MNRSCMKCGNQAIYELEQIHTDVLTLAYAPGNNIVVCMAHKDSIADDAAATVARRRLRLPEDAHVDVYWKMIV